MIIFIVIVIVIFIVIVLLIFIVIVIFIVIFIFILIVIYIDKRVLGTYMHTRTRNELRRIARTS